MKKFFLIICLALVCSTLAFVSASHPKQVHAATTKALYANFPLGESSSFPPSLSPSPDGKSLLYLGWTGTDAHVNLRWMARSDNGIFPSGSNKVTLADTASSGPSVATFNNTVYVAYRGTAKTEPDAIGIYTPGATRLKNLSIIYINNKNYTYTNYATGQPSIVGYNGMLYAAWTDVYEELHISYTKNPTSNVPWTDTTIDGNVYATVYSDVNLTVSLGTLYVTYSGSGNYNNTKVFQGIYSPGMTYSTFQSGVKTLPQYTYGGTATGANGSGTIWLALFGTDQVSIITTTSSSGYQGYVVQGTGYRSNSNPALGASFSGELFLSWLDDNENIWYKEVNTQMPIP